MNDYSSDHFHISTLPSLLWVKGLSCYSICTQKGGVLHNKNKIEQFEEGNLRAPADFRGGGGKGHTFFRLFFLLVT